MDQHEHYEFQVLEERLARLQDLVDDLTSRMYRVEDKARDAEYAANDAKRAADDAARSAQRGW